VAAKKRIDLALQGGGAHGAFTWGVLDRLLEDKRLEIEAISGTSAGAMNAVVLADGLDRDGHDGARAALAQFWRGVSDSTGSAYFDGDPWRRWASTWGLDGTPWLTWFNLMTQFASPYEFNPLNYNPLRDQVAKQVDFERLRETKGIDLFVTATNVETGRPDVFCRNQLTIDHVMASACLPTLYQAVMINGTPYWDGGYMGNPSLWPLYYNTGTDDILIVKVNPIERKGAPRTAREIADRLNEITFNASLLREFRAIDFVQRLIRAGRLKGMEYRDPRIHIVGDDALMQQMGESTKYVTEWPFLEMLRDKGRNAGDAWLRANYEAIGARSTVNLRAMFEGGDDFSDGPAAANDIA
jgi:NTE family protein